MEELALDARHTPLPAGQGELFRTSQRRDPAAAAAVLARIRAEYGDAAVVCAVLEEAHLPEAQYRWQPVARLVEAQPRSLTATAMPLVRRMLACPQPIAAGRRPGTARAGPARFEPPHSDAARRDSAHTGARQAYRHCGPFLVSSGWWWASAGSQGEDPAVGGTPSDGPRHGSPSSGHVRDNHVRYDCGSAGGERTASARARIPADRAYYLIGSAGGALEWVYYDRLTRRWYRQGWVE